MLIYFEVIIVFLIIFDYKMNFYRISPFSAIAAPYVVIIALNNLIAVNYGFYEIDDSVILMELGSLVCFFIGVLISRLRFGDKTRKESASDAPKSNKTENYRIDKIYRYCWAVVATELFRIAVIIMLNGIGYFFIPENEGLILTGPLGHLLLTIYPLLPILFYAWLNKKSNIKYLIVCIFGSLVLFSSLVKYHVIGLMVLIFLFVCMESKRYLKQGIIFIIVIAVSFFVLNYTVTFIYNKISSGMTTAFFFGHFWKYLAGSLIYDNVIFTRGLRVGTSQFYKLERMMFALPNLFIRKITGKSLFADIEQTPFIPVSNFGETGNVVDFIGYLYPSKGGAVSILGFGLLMITFGFIVNLIYLNSIKNKKEFLIPISIIMTFFCFFSFFAVYGGLIPPWEILVWGLIMPKLFFRCRKYKIKIGSVEL